MMEFRLLLNHSWAVNDHFKGLTCNFFFWVLRYSKRTDKEAYEIDLEGMWYARIHNLCYIIFFNCNIKFGLETPVYANILVHFILS